MSDIRYMIVFWETVTTKGTPIFGCHLVDEGGNHVGGDRNYAYGFSQRHAAKILQGMLHGLDTETLREARRAIRRWLWSEKNRLEVL